jgi:hypothetical protein
MGSGKEAMKAKSLVVGGLGGLLAGVMLVATSAVASANVVFCEADPPVQLVTPGGSYLTVNNQVYLPAGSQLLMREVTDEVSARADGKGGTLITVNVFVPVEAYVVSSVNRFGISAAKKGRNVVTIFLDVPIS